MPTPRPYLQTPVAQDTLLTWFTLMVFLLIGTNDIHGQAPERKWMRTFGQATPSSLNGYTGLMAAADGSLVALTGWDRSSGKNALLTKYAPDHTLVWQSPVSHRSGIILDDHRGGIMVIGIGSADPRASVTALVLAKYSQSQGLLLWQAEKLGNWKAHLRNAVAVDPEGDVIIAGEKNLAYHVAKISGANGSIMWERPVPEIALLANAPLPLIAVDAEGDVLMTAGTGAAGRLPSMIKLRGSDATFLWHQQPPTALPAIARPVSLAVDRGGEVTLFSSLEPRYPTYGLVTRLDGTTGELHWQRQFSQAADLRSRMTVGTVDALGNAILAGQTHAEDDGIEPYWWAKKLKAEDGAVHWETTILVEPEGMEDPPTAMALDASGNIILATSESQVSYVSAKIAGSTGALVWDNQWSGGADNDDREYSPVLAMAPNGDAVIAGASRQDNRRLEPHVYRLAAATGAVVWEDRNAFSIEANDSARGVAVNPLGEIVILSEPDFLAKYSPSGTRLWSTQHRYREGIEVSFDPRGDVVVFGRTYTGPVDNDDSRHPNYHTSKYAGATGELLWRRDYAGPLQPDHYASDDWPQDMIVDPAGDVFVVGMSNFNASYAAKYASDDGRILWSRFSESTRAAGAALGADDDYIIVGTSLDGNATLSAEKISGRTGATIWSRIYDRPGSLYLAAVDSAGNIAVAGVAALLDQTSTANMVTAKLNGVSGTPIWETVYAGTTGLDDFPSTLALDADGSVYVSGSVTLASGDRFDAYLVKYDGTRRTRRLMGTRHHRRPCQRLTPSSLRPPAGRRPLTQPKSYDTDTALVPRSP